jgi:tRNA threonylcarbamoyladenosine biosynthesis protein TsaE
VIAGNYCYIDIPDDAAPKKLSFLRSILLSSLQYYFLRFFVAGMQIKYSLIDMERAAKTLLEYLATTGVKVICFDAPMGAGKTTLINELCRQLGVTDKTSSPTFSIINEYITHSGATVYHADLYRVQDAEELLDIGFEDIVYSGNTCFIEWPNIASALLPDKTLTITIDLIDEDTRQIAVAMP